jgi:hypothetical protein
MRVSVVGTLLLTLGVPVLGACAASDGVEEIQGAGGGGASGGSACVPGRQQECVCGLFNPGIHTCRGDGSGWGACQCEASTGPCGDGVCSAADGESCNTCAEDCGVCAPCTLAPECKAVMVPPTDSPHVLEFDVAAMRRVSRAELSARLAHEVSVATPAMRVLAAALSADASPEEHLVVTRLRQVMAEHPRAVEKLRRSLGQAGLSSPGSYRALHPVPRPDDASPGPLAGRGVQPMGDEFPLPIDCGKPLLRIGVAQIIVHEPVDEVLSNDEVYCLVQAEAQTGGEVRVTPITPQLGAGESYVYSLESGVFWGQQDPRFPGSAIQITYDCIESDSDDGYANLIGAIGDAAIEIGGVIPGQYGWIVILVGVVAELVAAGLANATDDPLFNVQQTIPEDKELMLTNGGWWSVRRSGTHNLSDWDWELIVKAWGCAEFGTL